MYCDVMLNLCKIDIVQYSATLTVDEADKFYSVLHFVLFLNPLPPSSLLLSPPATAWQRYLSTGEPLAILPLWGDYRWHSHSILSLCWCLSLFLSIFPFPFPSLFLHLPLALALFTSCLSLSLSASLSLSLSPFSSPLSLRPPLSSSSWACDEDYFILNN